VRCPANRGASIGDEAREVLEEVDRGIDAGRRHIGHAFVAIEQRVRPDAQRLLVVSGTPSMRAITSIGSRAA
jgi:hypothetical protein